MSLFAKKKKKTASKASVKNNSNSSASADKGNSIKKISRNNDTEKLYDKISEEEKEVNNTYQQIGKLYYEEFKDEADEKLIMLCNVVDESNRIIDLCRKQILFLQGIKICSRCKAELTLDSVYCNKCGAKLDDDTADGDIANSSNSPAVQSKPAIKKCRECGSDIIEDTVFCTNCGAKIK